MADEWPAVASLREWTRIGVASREVLRSAIARGELRAYRPTARTIRVLREDLLAWLRRHAVEDEESRHIREALAAVETAVERSGGFRGAIRPELSRAIDALRLALEAGSE